MLLKRHGLSLSEKITRWPWINSKPSLVEDTESAGAWGGFVKSYTKTVTLFGNNAALKALKQGEEHGVF